MLRLILRFIIAASLLIVIGIFGARWIGAETGQAVLMWEYSPYDRERTTLWDGMHFFQFAPSQSVIRQVRWNNDGQWAWIHDPLPGDRFSSVIVWNGWNARMVNQPGSQAFNLSWSQDGRLVWISYYPDHEPHVTIWDGQQTTVLAPSVAGAHPTWSMDGHLAWEAPSIDSNSDIFVWDGGTITNLSQSPEGDTLPRWSSKGTLAWVTSNAAFNSVLVIWDERQVTQLEESGSPFATDYDWSPNGYLTWDSYELGMKVWDGSNIIDFSIVPVSGENLRWSPDGRLVWSDFYMRSGWWLARYEMWDGTDTHIVFESNDEMLPEPIWLDGSS